jgi:predicted Zn-dependent peptidase
MNAMKAMYHNNEINIDVAGTIETIAEIDKEKLYKIYNSFYVPGNMIMVLAGDFKPESTIELIKKHMVMTKEPSASKRIYNEEPKEIVQKYVEKEMDISMPCVLIGYKDNDLDSNKIQKDIAVEIIGSILLSKSSKTFEELYESGKIFSEPSIQYEFSKTFAHVMIQFQSHNKEDVIEKIEENLNKLKEDGIQEEDFQRAKKKLYGELVKSYSEVSNVASATIADYFKGISSFEYINEFKVIEKSYVEKVLNELFVEENKVISVINCLAK